MTTKVLGDKRERIAAKYGREITLRDPEIEALASQFEAAWKYERELGEAETDEDTDAADAAAVERTRQFARKIVALPGSDTSIHAPKSAGLPNETFESFAAKACDGSAEAALVSLFRDLGADLEADAELFALAAQLTECDALKSACPDDDDQQYEVWLRRHWALREKINRIPATTREGLRVKARAAEFAIKSDTDLECVGDGSFVDLCRSINQDIFLMDAA
jgi:hypothetical protein